MAAAVRVGDLSTHGGTVVGPGVSTVSIAGLPAAVAGDLHTCVILVPGHVPTVSPFPVGSATVMIGGRPALRTTDACLCGAMAAVGAVTVQVS